MTNETRQRIEHYTSLLPGMKEKVMAATMMFVMALVVMVTATYAWVTLSVAPEVTSVDTTVAANGSLEIALANGTGAAPGKSAEGDSTGAGNPINKANITWGNLVNLSDVSYGLNKITLRPAALNGKSGLLSNPLYGVGYGEDGRISTMVTDDDFAYVYYDPIKEDFLVDSDNSHLGVRAVSTFYYGTPGGNKIFSDLLDYTNKRISAAKGGYSSMTNESAEPGAAYMQSLEGLIQVYAQFIIDKRSNSALTYADLDVTDYVPELYNMLVYFNKEVMLPTGESYLFMTDMLDLMVGTGVGDSGYTLDSLVTASKNGSFKEHTDITKVENPKIEDYIGTYIKSLSDSKYDSDYITLEKYLAESTVGDYSDFTAEQKKNSLAYWAYYANNGGKVSWADISSMINWICDINSATLDGHSMSSLSSMSVASSILLDNSGDHEAVINGGAIYRMEKRIGETMSPSITVTVDASSIVSFLTKPIPLTAILTTSATEPYDIVVDRDAVESLNTGSYKGSNPIAEDTYAMALDLWIRTNSGSKDTEVAIESTTSINEDGTETTTTVATNPEKAYLTLEGTVITQEQSVAATTTDINGDEQPVYIAKYTISETEYTEEVFERYGVYYYIGEDNIEYEFESVLTEKYGETPEITYTRKMITEEVIVGYEGENRVWTEEQLQAYAMDGTSTTQGRGSCYIFYANTPADQSRFLELLKAMKVVFVNSEGRQIGLATMDTESYIALNGKVTVPLVLDKTEATNLGIDLEGNTIYGMTPLEKNVATRITALIYLDGSRLTNEMVLASGDIQGTLNIQFGCATAVVKTTTVTTGDETQTTVSYSQGTEAFAVEHETLMDDYINVSAEVSQTEFDYNPDSPAKTTLSVKVSGVEPNSVEAKYIRAISSTQGVQQESISLNGSGSDWSIECEFDKPGNYVLRTIWIDGLEYDLETPITIKVKGSSVNSLQCDAIPAGSNKATIMTAESAFSTDIVLGFNSSAQDLTKSKINGVFMDEEGRQVNVPFTLDGEEWKGTATFNTSGTFTMSYVEIDGEMYELSETLQPTLEIMLGLKVRTWITASEDTLNKLQAINENAVATSFVLDKAKLGGDVTLLVSAEVYDNNGNEITGMGNVKLYYGRAGSAVADKGLDSNMTWDSTAGRYTGSFIVTQAGTFNYSQLTVKSGTTTNIITSYTTAPSIQAMPPEDADYFDDYTDTYQYAPNKDATMEIGIAYSSAASRIEATLKKGSDTITVPGVMIEDEIDHDGNESVSLWSFAIPDSESIPQEGEWTLTDITMYGVYYNKQYFDDENGAFIDLINEKIHTKVINYLYVTLSGTSESFSGYFMEEHKVNDLSVIITDYDELALEEVDITGVTVSYYLDTTVIGLDSEYKYSSSDIGGIVVDGTADTDNSKMIYNISEMIFQYAGPYNTCKVSIDISDTTVDESKIVFSYKDNGNPSSTYPKYDVKWASPDVSITGTNPTGGTALKPSEGTPFELVYKALGGSTYVQNYYESYYANVYTKDKGYGSYDPSEVYLKLTKVGDKIDSDNPATLTIQNNDASFVTTAEFKSKKTTNGEAYYESSATIGSGANGVGAISFNTISVKYGQKNFNLALDKDVTIINTNVEPSSITYVIPEAYRDIFTAPKEYVDYSAKNSVDIAPSLNDASRSEQHTENATSTTPVQTKQKIYYAENGEYYAYNRTIDTWTETGDVITENVSYELVGWSVNGKTYLKGESIPFSGATVANAIIQEKTRTTVSSVKSTLTGKTIVDEFYNKYSTFIGLRIAGYNKIEVNKNDICTTPVTTYE